jgi:hypothetical protein
VLRIACRVLLGPQRTLANEAFECVSSRRGKPPIRINKGRGQNRSSQRFYFTWDVKLFHVGHEHLPGLFTWDVKCGHRGTVDLASLIRVTEATLHGVRRHHQTPGVRLPGDPSGILRQLDRVADLGR